MSVFRAREVNDQTIEGSVQSYLDSPNVEYTPQEQAAAAFSEHFSFRGEPKVMFDPKDFDVLTDPAGNIRAIHYKPPGTPLVAAMRQYAERE